MIKATIKFSDKAEAQDFIGKIDALRNLWKTNAKQEYRRTEIIIMAINAIYDVETRYTK